MFSAWKMLTFIFLGYCLSETFKTVHEHYWNLHVQTISIALNHFKVTGESKRIQPKSYFPLLNMSRVLALFVISLSDRHLVENQCHLDTFMANNKMHANLLQTVSNTLLCVPSMWYTAFVNQSSWQSPDIHIKFQYVRSEYTHNRHDLFRQVPNSV